MTTQPFGPPAVTDLAAQAGWTAVDLSWTNPTVPGIEVVVRRTEGEQPAASPDDGETVELSRPDAEQVTDLGLQPSTTYTYTVWTSISGGVLSDPMTVTVTTGDPPPAGAVAAAAAAAAIAAAIAVPVGAVLLRPEGRDVTGEILAILEPHYRNTYTGTDEDAAWEDFSAQMREALDQLQPDGTQSQVDRVVEMSAQAIVNHATHDEATRSGAGGTKTWWTMRDNRVRQYHRPLHGVTVPMADKFPVGPNRIGLDFPGQPVGPPEIWINCRCVLTITPTVTASGTEVPDMTTTMANGPLDEEDEDFIVPVEWLEDDGVDIGEDDDDYEYADVGGVKWHGVLAPEGQQSGDGRSFSPGALTWRDLPLPLRWQREDTGEHDGAIIVGTIDEIERDESGLMKASGTFSDIDEVDEVIGQISDGALRGVSVDVDSAELAANTEEGQVEFGKGRISAATLVHIPAFDSAYIALGDWPAESIVTSDTTVDEQFSEEFAISEQSWDGSPSRFTDEQYKRSCVLHRSGSMSKSEHSLPIREPNGDLNRAAVHAAASRINQVKDATPAQIASAKRALRGAYNQLKEEAPDSLSASAYARGPGWVTNPKETRRLHAYWTKPGNAGYAKIRWGTPGDFRRLRRALSKYIPATMLNRVAAQWHHDALGYWPGECGKPGNPPCGKSRGSHSGESVSLAAAATQQKPYPAWMFADPVLDGPTPLTVVGKHVYGHLATWGTCHIGMGGVCTTPPKSQRKYAYFRTGALPTDEGAVSVGQITIGTGHAGLSDDARSAAAHYDHTGSVVADVTCGEDDHGIWVAGALRDDATDKQIHALQAGALSGDWRRIGGNLELVAALVVNVPGFPVPRVALAASGGVQTSLVASSVLAKEGSIETLTNAVIRELDKRADRTARVVQVDAVFKQERIAAVASVLR